MKAKANGIDIHYTIDGAGPWLVMSHSLACDSRMWDEQVAVALQRFKVLRFDTRGHGQTDAPTGEYTLDMLADGRGGVLARPACSEAHWIGISMGAMIGQTLALKSPGLLKSLVLADTTSRNPPEVLPMWMERIQIAETKGHGGARRPDPGALVHRALPEGAARPREADRRHDPCDAGRGLCRLLPCAAEDRPHRAAEGDQDTGAGDDRHRGCLRGLDEGHPRQPPGLGVRPDPLGVAYLQHRAARGIQPALVRFYDRIGA